MSCARPSPACARPWIQRARPHASRDEGSRLLRMAQEMRAWIANLLMLARVERRTRGAAGGAPARSPPAPSAPLGAAARARADGGQPPPRATSWPSPPRSTCSSSSPTSWSNTASYAIPGQPIAITGTDRNGWVDLEVSNATDGSLREVAEIFTRCRAARPRPAAATRPGPDPWSSAWSISPAAR